MITYLFKHFYGWTYYAIIGFSITSLVMFIPKFESTSQMIIGTIFSIVSAICIYAITRLEDITTKKKAELDKMKEEIEGQKIKNII